MNIFSDYLKGLKIISSCKTFEQVRVANNWVYFFGKRYNFSFLWDKLDSTLDKKTKLIIVMEEYKERIQNVDNPDR